MHRSDAPVFDRLPRRENVDRLPRPVAGEPGRFSVDATWGVIQPLRLPGGVETLGELEVMQHVRAGGQLVDCRHAEHVAAGTLPTAAAIPHEEIVERLKRPARDGLPIVLFCNGPQCTATPTAIRDLLAAGWDPGDLRYYRGGIHDWTTLGLPLVTPA